MNGGFAGRILHIDLSQRRFKTEELAPEGAEKFIGGFGLTVKLASEIIVPGTDPLSPDNPIVFGAGPLVGTSLPATSRVYAVTKLPQSNAIGWCGGGGVTFGCLMKNAGYDHIVIKGRADHPVFIKIMDDDIDIVDAQSLWGMGVAQTCSALWEMVGRPAGIISIGQAGENLVSFSMAYIDRLSTIGRGGFGAVMGSKNLKAILVRGSRGIQVANRKRYRELHNTMVTNIREYPYLKEWQHLGLLKSLPFTPEGMDYNKIRKRRIACVSCPIGCKEVIEIPDGEFMGSLIHSSSIVNLLTPTVYGFTDYREAIQCVSLLDEYGLDMFEFFGVMEFAKDLYAQGRLPGDAFDEEIRLESFTAMEKWARKISLREGFGNILADGFEGIIKQFGEECRPIAPYTVKGMLPYTGPRGPLPWNLFGTMELGQALDPRGPHVGAGGSPTYFARRPLTVFPRHLQRMGVPDEAINRILGTKASGEEYLEIGRLLKYSHRWFAILGSLGICARAQINRFYNAALCAELYESVTGLETDLDDLRKRADRAWTLLWMANLREGMTREKNPLPDKWFQEPGFNDYLTDAPLSRDEVEKMVEDYFDEQGWNRETGIPDQKRLKELGL